MRKLLLLFIMLTAGNSESMIPLDNPGKITAHLKLIELPYGQHDTLKCVVYSLMNESEHDYYLPTGRYGYLIKFSLPGDTSLGGSSLIPFMRIYKLISEPVGEEGIEEMKILRSYLLSQQQHDNATFIDKRSFEKVANKIKRERINTILRSTPNLTQSQRARIKHVLMEYPFMEPVLLKAGSTVTMAISSDLVQTRKDYQESFFKNYPLDDCKVLITFRTEPMPLKDLPHRVNWVYADELKDVLPSQEYKAPAKIWYYDPVPYPKYKSYYPYLGDITCSDTIVIQSGYLLE